MPKILLLLLTIGLTTFSCKKEEILEETNLFYDNGVNTAPVLNTGTYEAMARFPTSETNDFEGQNLEEIVFYLSDLPDQCEVIIYGEGTATTPNTILYQSDVTNNLESSAWNSHTLSTPIAITGEDIWIGVRLVHNSNIASIGCDTGPANINGDYLWADGDNTWMTFRERTEGEVNINWNIRGVIKE